MAPSNTACGNNMKQNIFPIYFSEPFAANLTKQHFAVELEREMDRLWGQTTLTFYASLLENGDVDINVHHSSDNGFCQSSGAVLRKTFRPFNEEQIAKLIEKRKYDIAKEEYYQLKSKREHEEILKLMSEMFPEK